VIFAATALGEESAVNKNATASPMLAIPKTVVRMSHSISWRL
ncbi:unnamed protein product, partial [marine sediment metagenome]